MYQKDQALAWPHKRSHKCCYTPSQCYWHLNHRRIPCKGKTDVPLFNLYLKRPTDYRNFRVAIGSELHQKSTIPCEAGQVLDVATNSISTIATKTLSCKCKNVHQDSRIKYWNNKLGELTVQCKFSSITKLESQNNVWKRIQMGMPAKQLSFLLRAGSDTLPTPLYLWQWRFKSDAKCPLCDSPWPTVRHILNGCPVAHSLGRYTWQHDSALRILANGLRMCLQPRERLYAILPGLRATDNPPATIPGEILDTLVCPDMKFSWLNLLFHTTHSTASKMQNWKSIARKYINMLWVV